MRRSIILLMAIVATCVMPPTGNAVERGFIDKFCISAPFDQLCSQLPYDQADFDNSFRYMLIEKGAQDPFDVFAWQAFVALNWPADQNGTPLTMKIGSAVDAPRVWQSYTRRPQLFGPDEAYLACGDNIDHATLLINDLMQSDGSVLVDQQRNFVVYSTYANETVTRYIRANNLQHIKARQILHRPVRSHFHRGVWPMPTVIRLDQCRRSR